MDITQAFHSIVKTIAEVDPEQEYVGPDDYVALFRSGTEDYEFPWAAELQGPYGALPHPKEPESFVEADKNYATPTEALEALEQVIRKAYG